jgi:hypothetical protein
MSGDLATETDARTRQPEATPPATADADAATTTRYSGAGQVPPVAAGTGASTTAAPSASERAYGTQAGGP